MKSADGRVHYFGIRHHGPGSARSLLCALGELQPALILVEGPADATGSIPWAAHEAMQPPVALMIFPEDDPQRCAFYPFAEFSPEWQALRFALSHNIAARFMDLPQTHWLAILKARAEALLAKAESENQTEDESEEPAEGDALPPRIVEEPLTLLARAAGLEDGERWWDQMVEQRTDQQDVFQAIAEVMTALREELKDENGLDPEREALREAWMRREIRNAQKETDGPIAVICGAWHVPALLNPTKVKEDNDLLKGVPKTPKIKSTWVPWSHGRLSQTSGYGAGIESPGWYHHLWQSAASEVARTRTSATWMSRVAHLLRDEGLDVSSAHVIEAVRLSDTLSDMRGRSSAGLHELNEAILTVMLFGDTTPLRLIHHRLIVGEVLGAVPEDVAAAPIVVDLARQQKSLRLKPSADWKDHDLDLRRDIDLARSHLLHRLALLGVNWGDRRQSDTANRGTFRETWRLQWKPDMEVALIAASVWGNTVEEAAIGRARSAAKESQRLPELTALIEQALLANLGAAIPEIIQILGDRAATASDVPQLMEAVPPLANTMRYGNVRQVETDELRHLLDGLLRRIYVGLASACASLDDDAAEQMLRLIDAVNGAVLVLDEEEHKTAWRTTLRQLKDRQGLHKLVAGRCCRLLLDAGELNAGEAARQLGLALSAAVDALEAGWWIDGFLRGSGALLVHSPILLDLIDGWICTLSEDAFQQSLPIVRRTFSSFAEPERRNMGELLKGGSRATAESVAPINLDIERAERVVPVLKLILGVAP